MRAHHDGVGRDVRGYRPDRVDDRGAPRAEHAGQVHLLVFLARAGEPRRAFTSAEDLALFATIAPVLIALVPMFMKADTL